MLAGTNRRLITRPISAKPRIIIVQVIGSGTAEIGVWGTSGVAVVITGGAKIPPPTPPGSGMLDKLGGPPPPPATGVSGVGAPYRTISIP